MNILEVSLDNRELSFLIWGTLAFILILIKKEIRTSLFGILKILVGHKIVLTNIFMLGYVTTVIFCLTKLGFWDTSHLKGTILWILLIAFPLFFKANKANQQDHYFKVLLKDNIKVILILEFLINLYVFNILIELVILPLAFFIGGMSAYADIKKEYSAVKKVVDYIIGLLGIATIIYVIYNIVNDFEGFTNYDNLKSFLLPILLTILFIPAIYFQALFMKYELIFVRLSSFCKDDSLLKYIKFKTMTYCNLNLHRAKKFSKGIVTLDYNSKEKFIQSLKNL